MGFLSIVLYYASIIIRPADWYKPLLGAPVDVYIAIAIGAALLLTGKIPALIGMLREKTTIYILLYFIVSMVATLAGGDMTVFLDRFAFFGKIIYFYLALSVFIGDGNNLIAAMTVFMLLVGVAAYQGIVQYVTGMGWATEVAHWAGKFERAKWVGMYDGPNVYCVLLNVGFAIALQLILGPWNIALRLLAAASAGLIFFAVIFTNSRGGFLAFVAIVAMTVWVRSIRPGRTFAVKKIVVVGILCGILLTIAPSRMGEIKDSEGSAGGRIDAWYEGIQMLKENPVFGVGLGNWTKYHHLIAHNTFVQNMGEVGIIGLFFWVAMIYIVAKALFKMLATTSDGRDRCLLSATFVALGAMIVSSVFLTTNEFDLWYVLFSFCAASIRKHGEIVALDFADLRNIAVIEFGGILLVSAAIRMFYA